MATGEYKLVKMNSESSFDEKTIQLHKDALLSFDENLNPKSAIALSFSTEPPIERRIIGTRWYCHSTDRLYTWLGAWIDLHNTFPQYIIAEQLEYDDNDYESYDYVTN